MKGLLFSEPMVKAWMAGNKTVTRRLMNPQPVGIYKGVAFAYKMGPLVKIIKPRYRPGEKVYIKETWRETWSGGSPDHGYEVGVEYRARLDVSHGYMGKTAKVPEMHHGYKLTKSGRAAWRSPRFMFEWASRSHARIISVRPERVQEITNTEAVKEGFPFQPLSNFQSIWESLHPGSWERNDWVWRIELEKMS